MSTGADSGLVAIFGYGGEATAEALQTVAEAQRRGARALFVDTAQEFDAGAASLAGIDLSELLVMHPDDADRSMRAIRILAESGAVGFVAIDRASEFFSAEGDEKASRRRVAEFAKFAARSRAGCVAAVRIAQMRGAMFGNLSAAAAEDALRRRAKTVRRASPVGEGPYNGGFRVHPSTRKSPWLHSEKSKVGLGGVHSCTSKSA
ncbi:MAG: hypothetical protein ILO34_05220 [Kiritimatiellae bacterium]|nr:hypothetical protein [Kiritimatiellia bacterium]